MSHPHAFKAPHGHGHPGGAPNEKKYLPRLIAWEVTRSCVLNCVHCRAAAKYGPYPGELNTEDAFRFLDDVKSFSDPIIILTGALTSTTSRSTAPSWGSAWSWRPAACW